jgi:hypothetical protein
MVLKHTNATMYALMKLMHSIANAASMVCAAIASAMSLIFAEYSMSIFAFV